MINQLDHFSKPLWIVIATMFIVTILITVGFVLSPIITGDDWETFHGAAWRVLRGQPLYDTPITFAYFSNPPWVTVALIPFSLLPLRWGWALVSSLSFLAILGLSYHLRLGLLKTVLALSSPAMIYIALHGQIDALLLAGIFLPLEWRALLALAKPQVTFGLLFGIPPRRWLRALLLTAGMVLLSLAVFGMWPREWLAQPREFANEAHNLWLGLWPFQVPAGVTLILLGISRTDDKLLIAGSPFLSPYAATSSLIGPWLAVSAFLKDWQVFLVWLSWWGAVIYRGVTGG